MAKAGVIGRLAAQTSDRDPLPRTVHTFHGHVLEGYFGKLSQRVFIEVERRLARHTDALIAVSKEVRDELLELGIGSPEQWHVVPLGFDLAPFAAIEDRSGVLRGELGLSDDVPLVGTLGRLTAVKDHGLLFDAMSLLPDAHLVVVGDGELRSELEWRADQPRLKGRVHMLGWRRDIPSILADLDVVALTSRNEGTPVALIEALAASRPVVSTDVGGVSSVVRDGTDGLLVPSRLPSDVAAALARLLGDESLRRSFGQEGRQRAMVSFAKERLLADIRSLYRALLST